MWASHINHAIVARVMHALMIQQSMDVPLLAAAADLSGGQIVPESLTGTTRYYSGTTGNGVTPFPPF